MKVWFGSVMFASMATKSHQHMPKQMVLTLKGEKTEVKFSITQ